LNSDYQWPSCHLKISSDFSKGSSLDRKIITAELESFFSNQLGFPCILLPSGRSAISLAMISLFMNRELSIFAPKYSSHCVWNVLGRHANPSIQINKDINAVLAVHKYAEKYSLDEDIKMIIEDSCDSLILNKKDMFPVGGAFEIFSLPKIMGTYSGGILACANAGFEDEARKAMKKAPKIFNSQGYARWKATSGSINDYNIWDANEFQNFFLDCNALRQIIDNLDALESNKKIIISRLKILSENYENLVIDHFKFRLPPLVALSNKASLKGLMYRMIDQNRSLSSPCYLKKLLIPVHFGVSDQEFNNLLKKVGN